MHIFEDFNATLENLIRKEFDVEDDANLPFDMSFLMPTKDFSVVSTAKPTVNFYLYDIRENRELRTNEPIIVKRSDGTVVQKQPPARIELSYCITAWSESDDDGKGSRVRLEHKMLSEVLGPLIKNPTVPSDVLSGALIGQAPPLPTTVILPNGMNNPSDFWSALDAPLKPFLNYRVTISFDFHKEEEGPMVVSKKSVYGTRTSVYVLTIRPGLRFDCPANTALDKVNIDENKPSRTLDADASKNDTQIELKPVGGLKKHDFLMIVDSSRTEFCQLEEKPNAGQPVSITQPLLYDHKKGTELKKLTLSSGPIDAELAASAPGNVSWLTVKGDHASKLKVGEVFRLQSQGKSNYFQVTGISVSQMGLDEAGTLFQVGGIVTNSADSPAPILGAKVTLLDAEGAYVAGAVSDPEGRYFFKKLPPVEGKYTLKVEAEGYKDITETITDIADAGLGDFIIKLEAK
jgi:hypothetical protein